MNRNLYFNSCKWYYSPYRKNIDEVWGVLENYPVNYRVRFIKNLRSLTFKLISSDEMDEMSLGAAALYCPKENRIYIQDEYNDYLNHELFHVASCTRNKVGVMINDILGESLNEGITEYLSLKSKNKFISDSCYQRNIFVIESLIDIYGDSILKPYFEVNSRMFFQQFLAYKNNIIQLDVLLKQIDNNSFMFDKFLKYLVIRDLDSNIFIDNYVDLIHMEFNSSNEIVLDTRIKNNKDRVVKLIQELSLKDEIIKTEGIDIYQYVFIKLDNQEIYKKWIEQYRVVQGNVFNKIIKIIIKLGLSQNLDKDTIRDILIKNLRYKEDGLEEIKYRNKRLIRK